MTDAELVADIREKLKLSQTDLAKRLGVSPSAVSRWEAGTRALPGPARKLLAQMGAGKGPQPPAPGTLRKPIIYGIVALVLAGLGGSYFAFGGPPKVAEVSAPALLPGDVRPSDVVLGRPSATVTVVEYASMTCPRCARFQTNVLPQFDKDYVDTGKVKMIFREFPFDAAARLASALARCQKGDAFYAFVDLLFRNQARWLGGLFANGQQPTLEEIKGSLAEVGKQAGLSRDEALHCMDDPANLAVVDANAEEAQRRYHVSGTPTVFVGDAVLAGEISYDELKKAVDPLLVKG